MELLYIWVEKFRCFKRQSFNFNNEFRFRFEIENGIVSLIHNSDNLKDFWGNGIDNVTAVIGENGSGKSSILDIIKIVVGTNSQDQYRSPSYLGNAISIFLHEGKFYHQIDGNIKPEFNFPTVEISLPTKEKTNDRSIFSYTNVIYYTNQFENKSPLKAQYIFDLSINQVINNISEFVIYEEDSSDYMEWEGVYSKYRIEEIRQQVNFASSFPKTLPFRLPRKINIDVNQMFKSYEFYDDPLSENKLPNKIIEQFIKSFDYNNHDKQDGYLLRDDFVMTLRQTLLGNYIVKKITGPKTSNKVKPTEMAQIIKRVSKYKTLEERFVKFFDAFPQSTPYAHYHSHNGEKLNTWILNFTKFLFDAPNIALNNVSGLIQLNDTNRQDFHDVNIELENLGIYPDIINYRWEGISSGENAFLTLFSRFYNIKDAIQMEEEGTIIILLDECEIGFHPQWQKQLLKIIIDVFPRIFEGIPIQLILSSHSPIIISDLPKSNIIFVEKDENDNYVVDGLEDKKETFASNIHTIFTDSFFMKGGLIGDFAKEKINKIIEELNTLNKIELNRKEEIKKTILAIGEPIIRTKLMQLFGDKFKFDLDDRLTKLEQDIKSLKEK